MGSKPLTWQQVLIVLCVVGLLPAAIFAWGPNIPDAGRLPGMLAFILLVAAIVLLSISHLRRVGQKDLQPDVLAQLFNPNSAWQIGPTHFVIIGRQLGDSLQLTIVVQNLRDGEGQFVLRFEPEIQRTLWVGKTSGIFASPLQEFECTLLPASLVLATIQVPFDSLDRTKEIRLWLAGKASGAGNTVRFARRRAVTKRTSGWLTLLALFGGHLVTGGGTYLKIQFSPSTSEKRPRRQGFPQELDGWQAVTIWTPDHRSSVAEMVAQIRGALASTSV